MSMLTHACLVRVGVGAQDVDLQRHEDRFPNLEVLNFRRLVTAGGRAVHGGELHLSQI